MFDTNNVEIADSAVNFGKLLFSTEKSDVLFDSTADVANSVAVALFSGNILKAQKFLGE